MAKNADREQVLPEPRIPQAPHGSGLPAGWSGGELLALSNDLSGEITTLPHLSFTFESWLVQNCGKGTGACRSSVGLKPRSAKPHAAIIACQTMTLNDLLNETLLLGLSHVAVCSPHPLACAF